MYKGYIYKLSSNFTDKIYIGHTKNKLNIRFTKHKTAFNKYNLLKGLPNNKYHYYSAYEILKYNDCIISLIEEVDYLNIKELEKKEGDLILQYKNICCNKNIVGQFNNKKDYYKHYYLNKTKKKINLLPDPL